MLCSSALSSGLTPPTPPQPTIKPRRRRRWKMRGAAAGRKTTQRRRWPPVRQRTVVSQMWGGVYHPLTFVSRSTDTVVLPLSEMSYLVKSWRKGKNANVLTTTLVTDKMINRRLTSQLLTNWWRLLSLSNVRQLSRVAYTGWPKKVSHLPEYH